MPLWWTLILVAGILLNATIIYLENRKPKHQRSGKRLKFAYIRIALAIGLFIWSQAMFAMIMAAFSSFWVLFGAGIFVVLMGLVKQKLKSPQIKRDGKKNILAGLVIMALTYYFFYMR